MSYDIIHNECKNIYRGVAQLGKRAWFGTKRSEVQILSPRPLILNTAIVCIYSLHFDHLKLQNLSIYYF